jgi:hypothetical protein
VRTGIAAAVESGWLRSSTVTSSGRTSAAELVEPTEIPATTAAEASSVNMTAATVTENPVGCLATQAPIPRGTFGSLPADSVTRSYYPDARTQHQ